jgi:hypothetical protein
MIYNDVLLSNCTEYAHILEDVQSASCDAATWLRGVHLDLDQYKFAIKEFMKFTGDL